MPGSDVVIELIAINGQEKKILTAVIFVNLR